MQLCWIRMILWYSLMYCDVCSDLFSCIMIYCDISLYFMKYYEILWNTMKYYEILCTSCTYLMHIFCLYYDIVGKSWYTMIYYDILWYMVIYDDLWWSIMICYGLIWYTMIYYYIVIYDAYLMHIYIYIMHISRMYYDVLRYIVILDGIQSIQWWRWKELLSLVLWIQGTPRMV